MMDLKILWMDIRVVYQKNIYEWNNLQVYPVDTERRTDEIFL